MSTPVVAIRLRPHSAKELKDSPFLTVVEVTDSKTVTVTDPKVPASRAGDSRPRRRRFTFDHCFDGTCSQEQVHAGLSAQVAEALQDGRGACVLAYGQSSSGKTHTVLGSETDPGLGPRLCSSLFPVLSGNSDFGIEISYLEIYNERVRDLLSPDPDLTKGLRVREHPQKGTYVQNLASRRARTLNQLLGLIREGSARRCTGATRDNPRSSRSHAVLSVHPVDLSDPGASTSVGPGGSPGAPGALRLVDLAGSERAARCSTRLQEGAHINRSLVALGNVVSALATSARFVPYRGSALTWLLRDSLGGQSRTIVIATLSPGAQCYGETVNTLRFAARAGRVQPRRPGHLAHTHLAVHDRTIRELRAEIQRLRELLDLQGAVHPLADSPLADRSHATEACLDLPRTRSPMSPVMELGSPDITITMPHHEEHDAASIASSNSPTSGTATPMKTKASRKGSYSESVNNGSKKPPWKLINTSVTPTPTPPVIPVPPVAKRTELIIAVKHEAKNRLLEAARRALIAKRVSEEAETQTDPESTKRVKECSVDVQQDLNESTDVATGTEMFINVQPISYTRTCGNNTEVTGLDKSVQTVVTRRPISSFRKYLQLQHSDDSLDERIVKVPDLITERDDFPFESPRLPKTTIGSTKHELNDFKEMILGYNPYTYPYNLRLEEKISSISSSSDTNTSKPKVAKSVSFSENRTSNAIAGLIKEATSLMATFGHISLVLSDKRGSNYKEDSYRCVPQPYLPVSKWDKILTESCDDLERCIEKSMKNRCYTVGSFKYEPDWMQF